MTAVQWLDFGWQLAALVFAAGGAWWELRSLRKDLARLETKQDRYNNLQARVVLMEASRADILALKGQVERLRIVQEENARQLARLEDSCASAHKRITDEHYRERKG